jgi:hypothetical protein
MSAPANFVPAFDKPGFFENMPRGTYDALSFLRFSNLKYMARSPLAYKWHLDHPCEQTDAMRIGNAAHVAILEPEKELFAVWHGGRRNSNEYKAWCAGNEDKILLNEAEYEYIGGMLTAVHSNPTAHKYLRYGRSELSMVWRDRTFKRNFKARVDKQTSIDGDAVLVSLKTTADCRDYKFGAQYFRMGYHVQDCIYQNGYFYLTGTLPRMVAIAVEQKPPHELAVYTIPNDVLRQGQQDLAKWMALLTECEKTNKWPAAVEGEQELQLPSWAIPGGDFEFSDLEPIEK